METTTLQQRISDYNEKSRALTEVRKELVVEVGTAIADRLTFLYENRDKAHWDERWHAEVTFEKWLSASIEYDVYYVKVILDDDPELKELIGFARYNDPFFDVPTAANARLEEAGRTLGLNLHLTNVEFIGEKRKWN